MRKSRECNNFYIYIYQNYHIPLYIYIYQNYIYIYIYKMYVGIFSSIVVKIVFLLFSVVQEPDASYPGGSDHHGENPQLLHH